LSCTSDDEPEHKEETKLETVKKLGKKAKKDKKEKKEKKEKKSLKKDSSALPPRKALKKLI